MPKKKPKLEYPPTRPEPAPVEVSRMQAVPCEECGQRLAYKPVPGDASKVLTEHYLRKHP